MTKPPNPGEPGEVFGYAEALHLVHKGQVDEARERARRAAASVGAGPRAGSISDLMAAALTELLAALPEYGFAEYRDEDRARAEAIIDIALSAGRPAWAAAARAINGVGLISNGDLERGLGELVTAETELAEEITGGSADPLGKPQGVAAGHNNLGYAYLLVGAYELALPHLTRATSISRWGYGPELLIQAQMDVFNLGELHVRWALATDAAGLHDEMQSHVAEVVEAAHTLSGRSDPDSDGPWPKAAAVLDCAARSLTSPDTITDEDVAFLQQLSTSETTTFLRDVAGFLLARSARILGDTATANAAAERVAAACGAYDRHLADAAACEAALAQAAAEGRYAEQQAQSVRSAAQREGRRRDFSERLLRRVEDALAGAKPSA